MRIGIDLGGTKTEIICLDSNNGKELYRHRVPSPKEYQASIANMKQMVEQAESTLGKKGTIGVAIPGTISLDTGLVKNANSTWLNGKPLDKDISQALGNRPVRCVNDANCFAVSEATDGAGQDAEVVFAVIIGTGTGAGIAVNKKPLSGRNGIAGEWGHNALPWPKDEERPGPSCYCGLHGCMETWVSGPGMKSDFERVAGRAASTHDIWALAGNGDADAEACIQRYESRLARGLANVINILDPDVVILGGGMGNLNRLYKNIPQLWEEYVFSDFVHTKLVPPRHGDSSGIRGAAWLWNDEESKPLKIPA
ncbi:MAG: ROK family protein [Alphaproteobacteria bacterium]|nr:MAG: ROK family protein [Alphaproteobacteria bacterium]